MPVKLGGGAAAPTYLVDPATGAPYAATGGGGGGGAVTIADGADAAQGTTTGAAVVTDVAGTIQQYLRGLIKIFADIWDNTAHALKMKTVRSSTATRANVAGAAASTTILASNANRLGASIYNDSSAVLYLDTTGGTATSSNYTVQLAANSYFEVPFNYTGLITGIWASATGAARVVEYT